MTVVPHFALKKPTTASLRPGHSAPPSPPSWFPTKPTPLCLISFRNHHSSSPSLVTNVGTENQFHVPTYRHTKFVLEMGNNEDNPLRWQNLGIPHACCRFKSADKLSVAFNGSSPNSVNCAVSSYQQYGKCHFWQISALKKCHLECLCSSNITPPQPFTQNIPTPIFSQNLRKTTPVLVAFPNRTIRWLLLIQRDRRKERTLQQRTISVVKGSNSPALLEAQQPPCPGHSHRLLSLILPPFHATHSFP